MNNPFCSVVIPVYNCEKYIEETLKSVINQTFSDFEVIIVNDCSTDNSLRVIEEIAKEDVRIKVFSNEKNNGVAATRMKGVSEAKSDYIAFLDADDVWKPTKLEKQIDFILKNNAEFVYTGYDFINGNGDSLNIKFSVKETSTYNSILKQNCISSSTVIIKKLIIERYPMERSELVEDILCWLKILRSGYVAYGIIDDLASYRLLHNSRSAKKFKILKKHYFTMRYLGLGRVKSLWYILIQSINVLKKYRIRAFKRV